MATHAATRNISGLARALAQHGVMSEYEAETLQTQAQSTGASFVETVLLGKRMTRSPARGVRFAHVRQSAARPRELRPGPDPEGTGRPQDGAVAPRAAAVQAQQQAVRRDLRSGQPAGRWTKSGSRPTSFPSRSSSRTTSSSQAIAKLVEASGATLQGQAATSRTSRSASTTTRAAGRSPTRTSSDIEDAPVVKYIQKLLLDGDQPGRVRHPLRAVREILPRPLPHRRHPVARSRSRRWRSRTRSRRGSR